MSKLFKKSFWVLLSFAIIFEIVAIGILGCVNRVSNPNLQFANRSSQYTYTVHDVMVGDYIEHFGGLTWRVVDKTTDGMLVKLDKAVLPQMPFDAPRPLLGQEGYNPNRKAYNSVVTKTEKDETIRTSHARETKGSNFYWESDIRHWLNGLDDLGNVDDTRQSFRDYFSQAEWDNIAVVEQRQTFWWGDRLGSFYDKFQQAMYDIKTDASVVGSGADKYINRVYEIFGDKLDIPYDRWYAQQIADGKDIPYTGWDQVYINWVRPDQNVGEPGERFMDLPTYPISDKVFLPDVIQLEDIHKTDLKNQANESYAYTVDSDGVAVHNATRTAHVGYDNGITEAVTEGIDIYVAATFGNSSVHGSTFDASWDLDIVPMMYLSNDILLNNFGYRQPNLGEQAQIPRPSTVGDDNLGWRAFVLKGSRSAVEDLQDQDFEMELGQQFQLNLLAGSHSIVGQLPDGLQLLDNTTTQYPSQYIFGTPNKIGQYIFSIVRSATSQHPQVQVDIKAVVIDPNKQQDKKDLLTFFDDNRVVILGGVGLGVVLAILTFFGIRIAKKRRQSNHP